MVATDVGYVRDVVVDGETGVIVPVADPRTLARGITTAIGAHESMGQAARQRCLGEFDLAVVAAEWNHVLETLVS